ncbi:FAD-binding oxidoreductase [Actinomadura sp. WMMB 499]|uniref:FAD-binding oxidoreductase n=1 Tax=Actinomadura sp. WMMB 499 TaxID=1219491 RepID=UPI001244919D|nr:FAD-binding oxidoreductase [Actinomadura sp. WMMB 499]QFG24440.1 FAD-binding oxidoreductase [Actinomadura sp. WMMB 499]
MATLPSTVVRPGDKRYGGLSRGVNQRWVGEPEYVRLVRTGEEVRAALEQAVNETPADPARSRITVRAGGHCYEDFVCGKDVRVIIDIGPMCRMYYDDVMKAYCVEAGATIRHVYGQLYPVSGKVLPGGSCLSVGLGGHVPAGGFGPLSRQHGLTVDYLYAVEVAVVDGDRNVKLVVARRDDDDAERAGLLWAHTGGGGGNFGIVTRFWFRGLPEPPRNVLLAELAWAWDGFTRDDFGGLLAGFGEYFRDHQDPSEASGKLFGVLRLNHRSNGRIELVAQMDADDEEGPEAVREFTSALDGRIRPRPVSVSEPGAAQVVPWLAAAGSLDAGVGNRCGKHKSAYLREPFTERHIDAMWAYLGNAQYADYENARALIQVDSYGSAVNRPLHDTAARQRDSILKLQYQVYWTRQDPDEDRHLAWIRDAYHATFEDTGGVPVVGGVTDGCYVGYPDTDLNVDRWNGSGQTWATLYYKDAYGRLQDVKRRWDPLDIFRHDQSVRPDGPHEVTVSHGPA